MTSPPKVSVVLALYQKGAFVIDSIRSIVDQTFTDLEILVVDDGSTDDGPDRVRAFGDPRIRVLVNEENRGAAAAHDRGQAEARGEYIAILGADDIMLPDRLEEQSAYLDEHPEVGLCGSWVRSFGEEERTYEYPQSDEVIRGRMLMHMPLSHGACMIRRSVLERSGVRCREDWRIPGMDYFFLAELAGHTRMANLQKVLTLYRVGPQNMRHGRDTAKDRITRIGGALELFDMPTPKDGAEHLAMLDGIFRVTPDGRAVRRLRSYITELVAANQNNGAFPTEEFEPYMARRWELFFHDLLDRAPGAAWTYLSITPGAMNLRRRGQVLRNLLRTAWRGGLD